jgi:hypothetical protein
MKCFNPEAGKTIALIRPQPRRFIRAANSVSAISQFHEITDTR